MPCCMTTSPDFKNLIRQNNMPEYLISINYSDTANVSN